MGHVVQRGVNDSISLLTMLQARLEMRTGLSRHVAWAVTSSLQTRRPQSGLPLLPPPPPRLVKAALLGLSIT